MAKIYNNKNSLKPVLGLIFGSIWWHRGSGVQWDPLKWWNCPSIFPIRTLKIKLNLNRMDDKNCVLQSKCGESTSTIVLKIYNYSTSFTTQFNLLSIFCFISQSIMTFNLNNCTPKSEVFLHSIRLLEAKYSI